MKVSDNKENTNKDKMLHDTLTRIRVSMSSAHDDRLDVGMLGFKLSKTLFNTSTVVQHVQLVSVVYIGLDCTKYRYHCYYKVIVYLIYCHQNKIYAENDTITYW